MKRAAAWKFLAKLHKLGLTEPVLGEGRGHNGITRVAPWRKAGGGLATSCGAVKKT